MAQYRVEFVRTKKERYSGYVSGDNINSKAKAIAEMKRRIEDAPLGQHPAEPEETFSTNDSHFQAMEV